MKTRIAVGQAGGPTAVINDTLAGILYESSLNGIEVVGLRNGFEGGGLNPDIPGNLVDLTRLTDEEITSLRGIPGAYLGTTRMKLKPGKDDDKISQIRKNMDSRGIECVFYIGGNDSAEVILAEGKGIHVSKTEDNDLLKSHHTPGWGSACLSNSSIIKALDEDMSGFRAKVEGRRGFRYSNAPVIVYQTQGRDSGWLPLGSAFARAKKSGGIDLDAAPHLFLIRERAFDEAELVESVDRVLSKQGYAFIVCGEELVDRNGVSLAKLHGAKGSKDSHGHTEHGRSGAFNYAEYVCSVIKKGIKLDSHSRCIKLKETPITPQHIQRSLMRSRVDAHEAFILGRKAVEWFSDGHINFSAGLERLDKDRYVIWPSKMDLEDVAGKVRRVDDKYIGDINGPTTEFYREFSPLIQSEIGRYHEGPELKEFDFSRKS